MKTSQLFVSREHEREPQAWKVTILAETASDSILNAAERALEETATEQGARLSYRKEVVAESYMLGTVRAIHDITLSGTTEDAIAFFEALKNRMDVLTRGNPSYKILEENPKEWWVQPTPIHPPLATRVASNSFDGPTSRPNNPSRGEPQDNTEANPARASTGGNSTHLRGNGRNQNSIGSVSSDQAETTKTKAQGRISSWLLLGMTALLVLILVIANTLSKNSRLCLDAKQAVARQHLAGHSDKSAKIVGQREVSSGTEFEFDADGSIFTVVVDDLGQVKSWRKTK